VSTSPQTLARPTVAPSRGVLPATYRHVVVWTAYLYAATVPLLNTVTLPGLGTVSRATGVVFAAAGGIALLAERHRRPFDDAHWLALALLAWAALSLLWSIDPGTTERTAFTLAQVVLTMLLFWEFCRSREQLRAVMRAFVVGASLIAVQLVQGALTAVEDPTRYTVADAHPNSLAFMVSLAIVPAWYLGVTSPHRVERVLMRLFPVLALVMVVFTASRSALAVTGVALLVIPFTMGQVRLRGRLVGVLLVAAGVALALSLAPSKPLERLGTAAEQVESADLSGRGELWRASAQVLSEAPYVGVGLGGTAASLREVIGEDRGAHNTFLAVAVELGLIGLLLFTLLLVACLMPGLWVRGPDGVLLRVLALTLVLGLMPRHWHLEKATWLVLAIILGLAAAHRDDPGRTGP
jgi:O-antigen ligase